MTHFWAHEERAMLVYARRRRMYKSEPLTRWLDRLAVMGIIGQRDWNRENGRYFGYPECCIKWFLFMDKMVGARIGIMTDYIYGSNHCGYVQCPKCIKENRNENK